MTTIKIYTNLVFIFGNFYGVFSLSLLLFSFLELMHLIDLKRTGLPARGSFNFHIFRDYMSSRSFFPGIGSVAGITVE